MRNLGENSLVTSLPNFGHFNRCVNYNKRLASTLFELQELATSWK